MSLLSGGGDKKRRGPIWNALNHLRLPEKGMECRNTVYNNGPKIEKLLHKG